jgi:type II restriction/modification system DNA methylase subunit YeeA
MEKDPLESNNLYLQNYEKVKELSNLLNNIKKQGFSKPKFKRKPKLFFIITDQQRYNALGIAGNKILKTPNLNRLAKEGVHFKNADTSMGVCAPSPASI